MSTLRFSTRVTLAATGVALGVGVAQASAAQQPFEVGVFGDMPYVTEEGTRGTQLEAYDRVLRALDAADLAFVVHIGDLATGGQCSDSILTTRRREFETLRHPLVYTPGDNEWTDCAPAGFDPMERLTALRSRLAAPGSGALGGRGGRTLDLSRQSEDPAFADFSENVRWTRDGVVFLTVHMTGSNNNWGPDSVPSAELQARSRANIRWIDQAFDLAERSGAPAVAVFTHANPLPSTAVRNSGRNGFGEVMAAFERRAVAFGHPVALVHGDTHYFRIDKPFAEPGTRRVYTNITRAETFGEPNAHWLSLRVDLSDPEVLSFRPMIVPGHGGPGTTGGGAPRGRGAPR